MAGGLLNLISYGTSNNILNGNPSKTFFKTTYAKYTNFGLQKFRINPSGKRELHLSERTSFRFKVPRYADLLMDTYFVITLPNIWSPIYVRDLSASVTDICNCQPYEFKWIENIGSQLIRRVRYMVDDQVIQEFTGQYLYCMVQRDFSNAKKNLFDKMTGNVAELNDPANYSNRNGNYPNASYNNFSQAIWSNGIEPSIRGQQLYIPLNIWSTLSSKLAFPLVSMQYSQLYIEIDCRPITELFVLRDIKYFIEKVTNPLFSAGPSLAGPGNNSQPYYIPYVYPDQLIAYNKFYYFLKEPPPNKRGIQAIGIAEYEHYYPRRTDWNADIHLLATYGFLGDEEVKQFATKCQSYLIREVHEQTLYNQVGGPRRHVIDSLGLVASWMWFFQRSDVNLRNQWSNYSNWPFKTMPYPPTQAVLPYFAVAPYSLPCPPPCTLSTGVLTPFDIYLTGEQHIENEYNIMQVWGLYLDGHVREVTLDVGVVNYIEKYIRTSGGAKSGIYCYNFCLSTDPFEYQPSGAINLSKFNKVEFEYAVLTPIDASLVSISVTCDASGISSNNQAPITTTDTNYWKLFQYSYNLHIMEERYNILLFDNGVANLVFAR